MSFTGFVQRSAAVCSMGDWRAVRCRVDRLWLGVLRRLLQFDPWHANAAYSCRPYKKIVVDLVNSLRPETVFEVGCGLGDILSRVRARDRFGLDTDSAVIRGARFLHPGRTHWINGDAASIEKHMLPRQRIDCLIMVNWIHNLSPEQLAAFVLPILPRVDYLLLDSIDSDAPSSYRFRHDFEFLSGVAERISAARTAGEPRSFVLFKVV